MNSLGSLFPGEWRENLAAENLKVGAVIRIAVPDTTPPKIKIMIIAGMDGDRVAVATVFINSEINPGVINTAELQKLQMLLTVANCPFLNHDSYADCSALKARSLTDIRDLIKKNPSFHLGHLTESDLKKLLALIKSSRTIPIRLKKQFRLLL